MPFVADVGTGSPLLVLRDLGLDPCPKEVVVERDLPPGEPKHEAAYRTISAIVLGLAAVATGFAAYQAAAWSGQHGLHLALAGRADREAAALEVEANQERLLDMTLFEAFVEARLRGDDRTAAFFSRRFRPELAEAARGFLDGSALDRPNDAPHPMSLPRYRIPELEESRRLREVASVELADARRADTISASYVLGTVIAAFVGVFAGLAETTASATLRKFLTCVAAAAFLVAATWILTRPIAFTGLGARLEAPSHMVGE